MGTQSDDTKLTLKVIGKVLEMAKISFNLTINFRNSENGRECSILHGFRNFMQDIFCSKTFNKAIMLNVA